MPQDIDEDIEIEDRVRNSVETKIEICEHYEHVVYFPGTSLE